MNTRTTHGTGDAPDAGNSSRQRQAANHGIEAALLKIMQEPTQAERIAFLRTVFEYEQGCG